MKRVGHALVPVIAALGAGCGFSSEAASDTHDVEVVATGIASVDGLAWHPDGDLVAVEERDGGAVRRVNVETGEHRVVADGLDNADNVIVLADGTILVTQEIDSGRVAMVAPDGTVGVYAGELTKPEGLDPGPDGEIYVAEHTAEGAVFRIDADGTRHRLASVVDGEGLRRLPDGSLVVAETSEDRLLRIWPDGTTRRLAEDAVTSPDGIGWDEARARLLVSEDEAPGRLLQVDPDRGEVVAVVATGLNYPQTMVFEPDGSILLSEQGENRILRLRPRAQ
jgi:sugar lactone lactonase YvrE